MRESDDWNIKVLEEHYRSDFESLSVLEQKRDRLWGMLSPKSQEVCADLFSDPRFLYYPASKHYVDREGKINPGKHHCWLGGLIQHKTEVLQNAVAAAVHYEVDYEVLECGVMFHDSGKLDEYSVTISQASFKIAEGGSSPTKSGNGVDFVAKSARVPSLTSHLPLSIARWARAKGDTSGLTEAQYEHVMHLIVSHHGFREWGSPDAPRTIEAVLLHHADVLSVVGSSSSSPYVR